MHYFSPYSGLLVSSRLVSFSSHISCRLYPQWAVRVLSLPALAKGEGYQTQDPLETTVRVCVYVVCSLVSSLDTICALRSTLYRGRAYYNGRTSAIIIPSKARLWPTAYSFALTIPPIISLAFLPGTVVRTVRTYEH